MALNLIEEECLSVLLELQKWGNQKITRGNIADFNDFLSRKRDAISHLTNKKYGCASGRHSSVCTCKENEPGESWGSLKRKAKMALCKEKINLPKPCKAV